MKYDRPVWQLMHACADALPETFRYPDVRAWFAEHYPEVGDATIRAHLVGLTEGGAAKHPQFQRRSPVFRRVERGVYSPIPLAERGESPDVDDDEDDDVFEDEPDVDPGVDPGVDQGPDDVTSSTPEVTSGPFDRFRRSRRERRDKVADAGPTTEGPTSEEIESPPAPPSTHDAPAMTESSPPDAADPAPEETPTSSPRATWPLLDEADRVRARYQQEIEAERSRVSQERDDAEARRQAELGAERARIAREEAERARDEATQAIAEERERLARQIAEAEDLKAQHLELSRRAAEEIETQRRQLAAEREEMGRVAAERAQARTAAAQALEAERARLAKQQEELDRAASEGAEARRASLKAMEAERERLLTERERTRAEAAEATRAEAVRLAQQQLEAELAAAEQAEADRQRLAAERAETERLAAEQAEAARRAAEQAEAHRRAALEAEGQRLEMLRLEAARAEAAQAEAERLRTERQEAERVAADERRRAKKLRKAARRAREAASEIERERADRLARRAQDHRAGEPRADGADRRQRDEDIRRQVAAAVRDDLGRAEREALARLEADRRDAAEPAESEAARLRREEDEHTRRLRSTSPRPGAPRPGPAPSPDHDGGAFIVRAPRRPGPSDDQPRAVAGGAPADAAAPQLPAAAPVADHVPAPDVILLGSVTGRVPVPAPAKDAYRDLQFQLGRFDAELSGARWFVLSGEHGLLDPDEWASPDERSMADIDPARRDEWATWVVARLEAMAGPLAGRHVHLDAPDEFARPLQEALLTGGAAVTGGVLPTGWARRHDAGALEQPSPGELPDAQVLPFNRAASIAEHLGDPDMAVPADAARGLPHQPGLYAWLVDADGAHDLSQSLVLPVRTGVLYVGQVGADPVGARERTTSLNDHINKTQLYGVLRRSAFRTSLATALAEPLGLVSIEDDRLTQWMLDHLTVSVWPTDDTDHLLDVKSSVVDGLVPPLNTDHPQAADYRERLAALRDELG